MRRVQQGVTCVEFAIVAAVLFMVMFGVIEFSRALFVANALVESTRRGARVAAVCPVGDPAPAQVAILANGGGTSLIAPNLTTANVAVSYLNQAGAPIANPGANYTQIQYVQVRIVNYTMQLLIPFVLPRFAMPAFTATLPRESLGYSPTQQAFVPCQAV
ncbi:TadE/TadG family type IV pilus assembly protein [Peristeroidobacter soli]|jgi:Flp pilus assembly protein TadG|uniref:TadE/TadG family type IV pilus assembly protein n=1 Tax=Peristeroidobacter soli TaxID=2497877 RepID=UPI00101DF5C1|nr:TadE family protein [Peristeroidobacter soli]